MMSENLDEKSDSMEAVSHNNPSGKRKGLSADSGLDEHSGEESFFGLAMIFSKQKGKSFADTNSLGYSWVKEEVMKYRSVYQSAEDIDHVRKSIDNDDLLCEPCSSDDRVCFARNIESDPDFFFMYETFFSRLGGRLPFSQFECEVLNWLNVAPSQLHPNSWAFIRCFKIVCDYFGIEASAAKLFYFFQLKTVKEVGWISLNNVPGRRLLESLDQSYKHFKANFFKVWSPPEVPNCYLDDQGKPRFPLYWTSEPRPIKGVDEHRLPDQECRAVRFLKELPTLSCCALLYVESRPDALNTYMSKMAPRMSKKEWRELLGSDQPKQAVASVDARKKRRATDSPLPEKPKKLTDQPVVALPATETNTHASGSRPPHGRVRGPGLSGSSLPFPPASTWHQVLHDFEGDGEVSSLWNVNRDLGGVIDDFLMSNADDERLKDPGPMGLCRALATYGLRSAVIARSLENTVMRREVQFDKLSKEKGILSERLADLRNQEESKVAELKKDLLTLTTEKDVLIADKELLKSEKDSLESMLDSAQKEFDQRLASWKEMEEELRGEIFGFKLESASKYKEGFSNAMAQVRVLYPDLDLSATSIFKEVRDGQLFEESSEDEGEDDQPDHGVASEENHAAERRSDRAEVSDDVVEGQGNAPE